MSHFTPSDKRYVVSHLLSERYRPSEISDMVLLPRIKTLFPENELTFNALFYSGPGTGKTTLAKILMQNYDRLVINCSLDGLIDTLRESISDFCTTMSVEHHREEKIIILEEFDNMSSKFADALRAYMELYSKRIYWIATCNNIHKISDPIKSRFTLFNFEPQNSEEKEFLKAGVFNRIKNICIVEHIRIPSSKLYELIDKYYPDIRSVLSQIQAYAISPTFADAYDTTTIKDKLFALIFSDIYNLPSGDYNPSMIYNEVYKLCETDKIIDACISVYGKEFISYLIQTGNPPHEFITVWADYAGKRNTVHNLHTLLLGIIYQYKNLWNNRIKR